jgi:Holliday junction resolvase
MREKEVEAHLVRRVKKMGGEAEKFTSPGRRSVPDRLVTLPGGRVCFVECKATGKSPTDAQERDHERRRKRGFVVFVVDSKEAVDMLPLGPTVAE